MMRRPMTRAMSQWPSRHNLPGPLKLVAGGLVGGALLIAASGGK